MSDSKEIKAWIECELVSIKEQLHDILERIVGSDFAFSITYKEFTPERANYYGITEFHAMIKGVKFQDTTFKYMPALMTAQDYINSIRADMFSVIDGVVNVL